MLHHFCLFWSVCLAHFSSAGQERMTLNSPSESMSCTSQPCQCDCAFNTLIFSLVVQNRTARPSSRPRFNPQKGGIRPWEKVTVGVNPPAPLLPRTDVRVRVRPWRRIPPSRSFLPRSTGLLGTEGGISGAREGVRLGRLPPPSSSSTEAEPTCWLDSA